MTFDPETFLNQTVDSGATNFRKVAEGEYRAMIDDFDSSAFSEIQFTYKRGPRAGEPGSMHKFRVPFIIQDEALKAELGRDKVVVYGDINLDFDENGQLSMKPDRNIKLNQLREALGQNTPGWTFAQLKGAGPLTIKVAHRPNEKDPENPFVDVQKFARA